MGGGMMRAPKYPVYGCEAHEGCREEHSFPADTLHWSAKKGWVCPWCAEALELELAPMTLEDWIAARAPGG